MIEKLPLMGEPLSIKTRKQGRRVKISSMVELKDYKLTINGIVKKFHNNKDMLLTCHTISKHPKASEKEKLFALSIIEKNEYNYIQERIILSIKRKLMRLK